MFLDHTKLDTHTYTHTHKRTHTQTNTHTYPVGLLWTSDKLVAETATDTTHNKHRRRISISIAGFEPETPTIKWLQSIFYDRAATEIGTVHTVYITHKYYIIQARNNNLPYLALTQSVPHYTCHPKS
jgi:hypothetical protein